MEKRSPTKMIVNYLSSMLKDDQHEAYQERAAIKEYCAGITREKAEEAALMEIMKR